MNDKDKLLPGCLALGSGYDVFGAYANPSGQKSKIFDWNLVEYNASEMDENYRMPKVITEVRNAKSSIDKVWGSTAESIQNKLSLKVNIKGKKRFFMGEFKAEVTTDVAKSHFAKHDSAYSCLTEYINSWDLKMKPTDYDKCIIDAIKKNFFEKENLDISDVKKFYDDYGLFFVSGLSVGASVHLHTKWEKETSLNKLKVENVLEMGYKSLAGRLDAATEQKYKNEIDYYRENGTTEVEVFGGDAHLQHNVLEGDYSTWLESVGDNPNFSGFTDNGLTPYWELIKNTDNKKMFKEEWERIIKAEYDATGKWWSELQKLRDANMPVEPEPETPTYQSYLDGFKIVKDGATLKGYTKIDVDLNKGAGGKTIFIGKRTVVGGKGSKLPSKPIIGLRLIKHKDTLPPKGYTKYDQNLNEDAGGTRIYLCYQWAPNNNLEWADQCIHDIKVTAKSNDHSGGQGWKAVPDKIDLNKGSHGDYVYLWWK